MVPTPKSSLPVGDRGPCLLHGAESKGIAIGTEVLVKQMRLEKEAYNVNSLSTPSTERSEAEKAEKEYLVTSG